MHKPCTIVAVLLLLPACDITPGSPNDPASFLKADVTGAVLVEHRGGGNWSGGTRSPGETALLVVSRDPAAESSVVIRMVGASRWSMEPGVYQMEPIDFQYGEYREGYTAVYRAGGDRYVAESGTLTVTEVSPERVEGSFDLTAIFWCRPSADREQCMTLPALAPGAPRVRLVGEFSAPWVGGIPVPTAEG